MKTKEIVINRMCATCKMLFLTFGDFTPCGKKCKDELKRLNKEKGNL